jgi:primosomal protein N' (replication factor Y)
MKFLGVGTQKVEAMLEDQFENVRILRLDVDTTGRKGAHDRILEAFRSGKADILLGTQMVAKGLDFPGVTLVGVISADTSIHLPDFRAGERTFQLLTQVSGRAGRGDIPGEVVIQTYLPDGDAVQCALEHDFLKYAQIEMEMRKPLGYPPYGRMALILFKGKDETLVSNTAANCADELRQSVSAGVEILGPVQAPLARIKRTYRWQVVLKSESPARLNSFCRLAREQFGSQSRRSQVVLSIDVDPVSML